MKRICIFHLLFAFHRHLCVSTVNTPPPHTHFLIINLSRQFAQQSIYRSLHQTSLHSGLIFKRPENKAEACARSLYCTRLFSGSQREDRGKAPIHFLGFRRRKGLKVMACYFQSISTFIVFLITLLLLSFILCFLVFLLAHYTTRTVMS